MVRMVSLWKRHVRRSSALAHVDVAHIARRINLKKYWITAAVGIVIVGIYAVSSTGINAVFSSMQKGHSPARARTIFLTAGLCKNTFRYERALIMLDYALERYPDHPAARDGRYNYAVCLDRLGRNMEAVAAYKEYLSTYPGDSRTEKVQERIDAIEVTATGRSNLFLTPLREVC